MMMDALALSGAIKSRQVSCVEVMNASLDRIEALNPKVNAIVSLQDRGDLLRQARRATTSWRAAECRGWLHGFPQALKDLAATRGIRTTQGSPHLQGFRAGGRRHHGRAHEARPARSSSARPTRRSSGSARNTYNDVFGRTLNAYDQTQIVRRIERRRRRSRSRCACCRSPTAATTAARCATRPPGTMCSASAPRTAACRRKSLRRVLCLRWACRARWRATCRTLPCCCRCRRATTRALPLSNRQDPAPFAEPLERDFKGARIALARRLRRLPAVRARHARPLQVGAEDIRSARLHRRGGLRPTIRSSRSGRTGGRCAPGRPARR